MNKKYEIWKEAIENTINSAIDLKCSSREYDTSVSNLSLKSTKAAIEVAPEIHKKAIVRMGACKRQLRLDSLMFNNAIEDEDCRRKEWMGEIND